MKLLFLSVFILSIAVLSACTAPKHQARQKTVAPKQDFLTTGRGLSDGSVDLYRPGADFLPTEQFPATSRGTSVSAFSGNTNILVNDPSVTIYSLDSMEASEPKPAPLPPLQPPTNIRGDYPSPFDANGNPT